jgi:hypothetical protein
MAGLSYGGGWSTGLGDTGLGSGGYSDNVGLQGPSGGFWGGGGSGGSNEGQGLQGSTQDLFSYDPSFSTGYNPTTSYSLGDLYGSQGAPGMTFDGSVGLQMPDAPGQTGIGMGGYEPGKEDFWDSPFGSFLKKTGRFAANFNPVTRAGMGIYDAVNALQNGQRGQAAGTIAGLATGNGLVGAGARIGVNALDGKPVGGDIGGTLGSLIGGGFAGPVGGMVGGVLGNKIGNQTGGYDGYTDRVAPQGSRSTGADGFGLGDAVAGLGSLYLSNQALQQAKAQPQQQQVDLNSMFGPDSSYATQLRQQLERRDAAGGRRSQYGPREVELQAKLAEMQSRAAPGIMNANTQAMQANSQQEQLAQQRKAQMLSGLFAMGKESGLFDKIGSGLSGLFSGGGNSSTASQPLYFDSNSSGVNYSL